MGEVKSLVDNQETKKVERLLGADIESASYEELSEKFDEVKENLESKTYGVALTQDAIALLSQDILPKVEWVGQQAWDIAEAQSLVSELKPNKVKQFKKESIRALFQLVAAGKFIGTDNINTVKSLLTTLAEVIQKQINVDEQNLRDAGFELHAAEMGIIPEVAMQHAMAAKNQSEEK